MRKYNHIEINLQKTNLKETIHLEPGSIILSTVGTSAGVNIYYHYNPYRKGKKVSREIIILKTGYDHHTANEMNYIDSSVYKDEVIHIYEMI